MGGKCGSREDAGAVTGGVSEESQFSFKQCVRKVTRITRIKNVPMIKKVTENKTPRQI